MHPALAHRSRSLRLPLLCMWIVLLPGLSAAAAADDTIRIADRDTAALIRAIEQANLATGPTRIALAAGGLYTLDAAQPGQLGLPAIRGRLAIDGHGAEIRRYSPASMTLLEIAPGADVELSRLTLAEGSLGAIRNRGRLRLQSVVVSDSTGEALRGIVVNHGDMQASDSVFAWNRVEAGGRDIGTIINHGRLELRRSSITDNRLSRQFGTLAAAGAVLNFGALRLDDVDVGRNAIDDELGGLAYPAVVNLDSGRINGTVIPGQVFEERLQPARP